MLADAAADPSRVNRTASRKIIPLRELKHADELQVVSNFDVLFFKKISRSFFEIGVLLIGQKNKAI